MFAFVQLTQLLHKFCACFPTDSFADLVGHFEHCRQCGVAGRGTVLALSSWCSSWSAYRGFSGNDVNCHYFRCFFHLSFLAPVFPMVFSAIYFSCRLRTLIKNLGIDTFPDPVGHFGASLLPFIILLAVSECPRRCQDIFLFLKPSLINITNTIFK